mgnify:CR=1 FL=1
MIIGATTGNVVLHVLITEIFSRYIQDNIVRGILYGILIILEIVTQSGGIAVITGTLLIIIDHYRLGKLISLLGTGIGLIGFFLLVILQLIGIFYLESSTELVWMSGLGLTTIGSIFGIVGAIISMYSRKKIRKIEREENLNFREYLKREYISIILTVGINILFFIMFEYVLAALFFRFIFLDIMVFLSWQLATISISTILIILNLYYKAFRVFFLGSISIISALILIYTFGLPLLLFLNLFLIIIFLISIIANLLTFIHFDFKFQRSNKNIAFIILILSGMSTASMITLTVPENSIIITPKTEPELIFWVDSYKLPEDNETLEICKKYNIGFMPAISPPVVGQKSLMDKYKNAIAHGINLYFLLITPPDVFINIYNAPDYPSFYKDVKNWFEEGGIFDHPNVKAFCIDAEPPKKYLEKVQNASLQESLEYYLKNFPSKEQRQKAEESLNKLVKEIRNDGKESGIVKIISYMDESDGDGDLELFLGNIYSLNVSYDFSVTMIYRTEKIVSGEGDDAETVVSNTFKNIFGLIPNYEENVLPAYNFYKRVGIEQTSGQIQVNIEKQYIFIGTLKEEFNGTDYVKNREYLDDLDICRHFYEKKVFFYNYENFIQNYGIEELERVGQHNQKQKSWELKYHSLQNQITIIFYMALIYIDLLMGLEYQT